MLCSFAKKNVVELGVGVVREFDDVVCMLTPWHYAHVHCFL
jgi:hypothetical protein